MKDDIGPLWARIKSGDAAAWAQLVRRYAGLVYSEARRAGLRPADAEDCAQHAWLALYRRRRQIRDAAAIPAWLIRTTRRQAARMAQRLGRETTLPDDLPLIDPAMPGDEQLSRAEFRTAVAKALSRLDPRCRRLLLQLFVRSEPRSYREIARSLGVAPNTIGSLRSRCLARLRKKLEELGW